jgi:hypothetical protein
VFVHFIVRSVPLSLHDWYPLLRITVSQSRARIDREKGKKKMGDLDFDACVKKQYFNFPKIL